MTEDTRPAKKSSKLIPILTVLLGLVVILVVVIAMRPSTFRVERSATMNAPPSEVFAQVNDFHKWEAWNPWGKIDPEMKQTFVESNPNDLIRIKLEFLKPMAATNTADFTFKPEGEGTQVSWAMFGENNFMAKAIHMLMDMDTMIGGMFEKGLSDMKAIVEGAAKE
jgi:hypothetical protein